MLLAIDIGNTRIKVAVFENNTLLEKFTCTHLQLQKKLQKSIETYATIDSIIVSSVGKLDKQVFLNLKKGIVVQFVSSNDHFPFNNLYATPTTLGIDRMVLASGAVLQFPKKNRLIIDAGTCITYDFVDENDNYLGGAISPGLQLRYEALHNYTANLPLLKRESPKKVIGNSTNQSIHSGVVNGITLEMEGFINTYYKKYKNFIIILTGGDSDFLAKRLKNTIFANSNFLLESLNQLFQYNQND
jgi:type III pantothenate kinase